jgi:hypothetical protein
MNLDKILQYAVSYVNPPEVEPEPEPEVPDPEVVTIVLPKDEAEELKKLLTAFINLLP